MTCFINPRMWSLRRASAVPLRGFCDELWQSLEFADFGSQISATAAIGKPVRQLGTGPRSRDPGAS